MTERKAAFNHWVFRVNLFNCICSLIIVILFSYLFSFFAIYFGMSGFIFIISMFIFGPKVALIISMWISLILVNVSAAWSIKVLFIDKFFTDSGPWKEEIIPERVIWNKQAYVLRSGSSKVLYNLVTTKGLDLFIYRDVDYSEIFLPNASDLKKLEELERKLDSINLYRKYYNHNISFEEFLEVYSKDLHPEHQMELVYNLDRFKNGWKDLWHTY